MADLERRKVLDEKVKQTEAVRRRLADRADRIGDTDSGLRFLAKVERIGRQLPAVKR